MRDIKYFKCCSKQKLLKVAELDDDNIAAFNKYNLKYYKGNLTNIFSRNEFELFNCLNCGHFQYNMSIDKKKISMMYKVHSDLKKQKKKDISKNDNRNYLLERKIINRLKKIKRASKNANNLLDFGAGAGLWSKLAHDIGFKVTAYEPNSNRFDQSTKFYFSDNWEDITTKKYDVILCNQVLEHVIDPKKTLKKLKEVMHKNTLLLCNVPNVNSLTFNQLIKTWPYNGSQSHVMAPFQHLHGYTQKSFLNILKSENFTISLRSLIYMKFSALRTIAALVFGNYFKSLSVTDFIFKLK